MKRLLIRGANIEARDKFGRIPLYYTVDAGLLSTVVVLLESGAQAGLQDLNDAYPLQIAAQRWALPDCVAAFFKEYHLP